LLIFAPIPPKTLYFFSFTGKFFAFLSCKVISPVVGTLENHRGGRMSGLGPLFLFLRNR
jgi:hypothetical protein